jgi:hypothetical protein
MAWTEPSGAAASPLDDAICIYRFDVGSEVTNKFLRDYSSQGQNWATNPAAGAGIWTNLYGGAWRGYDAGEMFSAQNAAQTNLSTGTYLIGYDMSSFANGRYIYHASVSTNNSTLGDNRILFRTSSAATGIVAIQNYTLGASQWASIGAHTNAANVPIIGIVAWSNNAATAYSYDGNTGLRVIGTDTSFVGTDSTTGNTNNFLYVGGSISQPYYTGYVFYFVKWNRMLNSNEIVTAIDTVKIKAGIP